MAGMSEEEAGEEARGGAREDEGENAVSNLLSLVCCVMASEKRSRGDSLSAVVLLALSKPSNIPSRSCSGWT